MDTVLSTRRLRTAAVLLAIVVATGCASQDSGTERAGPASDVETSAGADPAPESTGDEGQHEGHAEGEGIAALGESFDSMDELAAWVQDETGECAEVAPADRDDLVDYLGPQLAEHYEPFVSEWATCSIPPYDRLGLVRFEPARLIEFQESWQQAQADGRLTDNPDWAFGNGFAITAGPAGNDELGLHYLWCAPVDIEDAHRIPADVEGCEFARTEHH
ncbi:MULTISPECIES: hypothetical protein [Actinoalloteichus]|uniref:Septum formation-related domain-containing protein n=1 Tax=Actinoalloteichus fjordicus TaxID=1612552 RepID=A0AAC9LFA8_9PSEU|nr:MULTISPECIES: hypothetical protein [Actinoalloteichus]APU15810.1 hypothetical protein UA74_18910 [Actinoalloteichus fjordicus]APU21870.1 hypothetical protein UA75_19400 [Actinoalloteichus sp. GBA129-24]